MRKKVDYVKLLRYIKRNSPCLTANLHQYIESRFGIESESYRSHVLSRLVKLGHIKRDDVNPNAQIHYINKKVEVP